MFSFSLRALGQSRDKTDRNERSTKKSNFKHQHVRVHVAHEEEIEIACRSAIDRPKKTETEARAQKSERRSSDHPDVAVGRALDLSLLSFAAILSLAFDVRRIQSC